METIDGSIVIPAAATGEPVSFGPGEQLVRVHTVRNSGEAALTGLILVSPGDAEHDFVPVESP